jgi:Holliday junction DNA helicase RuvA
LFDYISGNLEEIGDNYAVIDSNGMGYTLYISKNTAFSLPRVKSDVKLYAHVRIKDESMIIYGFINKTERELYLALNSVSGVGPKAAMAILSGSTVDEIILAIINNDSKFLSRTPGIGAKTANRIIIDLKDKFGDFTDFTAANISDNKYMQEKGVCIDALLSLGYSYSKACVMVDKTFSEDKSTQNNILAALSVADSI